MIKTLFSPPVSCLSLLVLGSLFLLSACTPTTAGPSAALKQQFSLLQQQQRQQAEQLERLQQQLAQLQYQNPNYTPVDLADQQQPSIAEHAPQTELIPAAISQELTTLADSASSYLAAFSNLAAGRYTAAEDGFNNFLDNYPEHQYSPNARYWLASAQLSQGKLQLAAANLRQLILAGNGQERAPAALLLLAKLYRQQQLENEADEALEQLRNRYPESSEAQHLFQKTEPE